MASVVIAPAHSTSTMKTFVCVVLLAACTLAAPAPEESRRHKRYSDWEPSFGLSSYSVGPSFLSHAPLVYSSPAVIHEPTIVSVKKIVSVPRVVSVKKYVSVPRVVSAPYISHSYAPSYSAGWW